MPVITVKAYISKYDVQGEDVEVDTSKIKSQEDWKKVKQSVLSDFDRRFGANFKRGFKGMKGFDFDSFGKGTYKDTRQNRKLGRVGRSYDKASALKQKLREMARNREVIIRNENKVTSEIRSADKREPVIRRKWQKKEVEFLQKFKGKLTYRQIGERLNRSQSSVGSKSFRLRRDR